MILTNRNYYGKEAALAYWSASQIKEMLDCEARALAHIRGEWEQPYTTALAVGSYVDMALTDPSSLEHYYERHPEMFKRDGSLKAEFAHADEMIDTAKADPVFMAYLSGRKQVIKTGTIGGYPFRARLDVLKAGKRIVDLKTVKDLDPVYKPGQGRLNFADAWDWPLQMAIYQELEGNKLPCYLAVITKEDPPQLELVEIPQARLDAELDFLKAKLQRFDAVKIGAIEPHRCGRCAYCRATKKLTAPISLDDLTLMEE